MSQKANPRLIGVFILVAFFISVGTFLLMNRDRFFTSSIKYVLYFQGSVKGLNVGSPVVFNGVPVGRVIGISLVTDMHTMEIKIPVYIETNQKSFVLVNEDKIDKHLSYSETRIFTDEMIQKGLRARLIPQSILTGQMMIDLSYVPDSPIILVSGNSKLIEIPTLPSITDELTKTLQNLPLDKTFKNLNLMMEQATTFLDALNKDAPEISKDVRSITSSINHMTKKAEKALGAFDEDSRTMIDLNQMLRNLTATAQSLRNLTDYLERHPEALLKGKGGY